MRFDSFTRGFPQSKPEMFKHFFVLISFISARHGKDKQLCLIQIHPNYGQLNVGNSIPADHPQLSFSISNQCQIIWSVHAGKASSSFVQYMRTFCNLQTHDCFEHSFPLFPSLS